MTRLSEKGVSYMAGFFMLVAFSVAGNIIGSFIGVSVAAAMSGQSVMFIMTHLQKMMGDAAFLREMQVIQSFTAVFGFLLPTLFTASRLSREPLQLTGFKGIISGKQAVLTLFIIAAGLALSGAFGYFTYKLPFPINWRITFDQLENTYAEAAAGLINLDSMPELLLSIGVLALMPAICEEAFFRGGLQNYLYRGTGKMWLSVIIVSVIFSAVHFSVYGFLSRVALGIILGLLYQYSGKLWLSILAHFINNATAVIMMYVAKTNGKSMQDILNDKDGSYLGFIAIPIVIFLFIQYKRSSSPSTSLADGV
ncbi:CPBP family intramembrane glutamic endopeptidase [Niabella ginsengisoli]|uniref:CPBP family intramembrane metalloprotease n=1 Tax=Niabella ginsengisoli TaxID=522298 RepID=A0ABS9SNY0_9BACT|nr:CPBP family intramembrane glutamic endopeptidase [Niabella ginsengisoli]MCH5600050.1 CPBP family intramembrane metalloprotease [Niabella ginsengisoli]